MILVIGCVDLNSYFQVIGLIGVGGFDGVFDQCGGVDQVEVVVFDDL